MKTRRQDFTPVDTGAHVDDAAQAPAREWSAYQSAIFRDVAEGRGHTVVLARAGSGKTTTILEALRHVPRGKSVLFVAFNKAIAEELKTRAPSGVEVSTLHSYGLRAVTRACGRLKIDAHRAADFIKQRLPGASFEYRRDVAKVVSLAKGALASDEKAVDALIDAFGVESADAGDDPVLTRQEFISDVLATLERCKDTSDGRLDFDDMVWLPIALDLSPWAYDRVFVDETQDLNPCQIELVLRAVRRDGRICAVGDDRQAIYRFRGADENAVGRVVEALHAKTMPLSVTYRCARSIVDVAKGIVADLECPPSAAQGVVRHVDVEAMRRDVTPGDFILSRTNAPLVGLCLGFLREGRRAHIQGRDIGATLNAFVKKSGCLDVPSLRKHIDGWRDAEVRRLLSKEPPRDTQAVDDKADTLLALSDGAQSIAEVTARIEALFSDNDDGARIVLSTTHKAKGLERDRVWMLRGTYRRRPGVEEDNLYYVCVTRAKRELVFVSGFEPKKPWGDE